MASGGSVRTPTPPAEHHLDRRGALAGIAAYGMWGVFPLVFHLLDEVAAPEVLAHRIIWSFVLVGGWLAIHRDHTWVDVLRRGGAERTRLAVAAVLVSINWLVYVWAVAAEHVVEAALGYYINPLITVAIGVVVFHERLRALQIAALAFAAAAVVVLAVAYGRLPWIALTLAFSFAGYGALKRTVRVASTTSLAVETAFLAPFAVVGLAVAEATGRAAFFHGPAWQTLLLVSLGAVTAIPLALFATAARLIPLTMLGLLQYLTPTMQLLCGVLLLGESLPPERVAGFVLVWVALAILGTDALRAARRPASAPSGTALGGTSRRLRTGTELVGQELLSGDGELLPPTAGE